jgi:hypothetical protein
MHARQVDQAAWAASNKVDRVRLDIRPEDSIHLMRRPARGRPFLIANREVTALVRHFRLWSWAHLALTMAALLGLTLL